jgi:hypothetical protein
MHTYFAYFNMKIKEVDKPWISNNVCKTCRKHLRQWMNVRRRHSKFSVPMVWRDPKNHYDDCCFCLINLHGANRKKRPIPIWNPPRDVCLLSRQHHQNPYLLLKPLHNGNKYGAVPIAHSIKLKDGY